MALSDVIERLAEVNEEQLLETQNVKIEIESLSDRFASFIRIAEGDKLDKLEERREERKKSRGMGFAGRAKESAQQARRVGLTLIDLLVKGAGLAVAAGVIIPLLMQNEEVKEALGDLGTAFGTAAFAILEPLGSVIGTAIIAALNPFAKQLRSDIRMAMNPATDSETQAITQFFTEGPVNQKRAAQLVLGTGEFEGLIDPLGENATPQQLEERKQRIRDVIMTLPGGEKALSGGGAAAGFTPISTPEEQAMRLLKGRSELTGVEKFVGIDDLPFDLESLLRIQETGGVRLLPTQEIVRGVTEAVTGQDPSENLVLTDRGFVYPTEQDVIVIPEVPTGTISGDAEPAPLPGIGLLREFFSSGAEQEEVSAPLRVLTPEERISLSSMGASPTTNAAEIKGASSAVGVGSAPAPAIVPVPIPTPSAGAGGGGGPVPGKHGVSYMSGESKFTPFFRMSAISGSLDLFGSF